jgi:hypothetical protein
MSRQKARRFPPEAAFFYALSPRPSRFSAMIGGQAPGRPIHVAKFMTGSFQNSYAGKP